MNEIMKIGCPCCGSVLTIKYQPGIEQKSLTCPICQTRTRVANCRQLNTPPASPQSYEEHTEYPSQATSQPPKWEPPTEGPDANYTIGRLTDMTSGRRYQLSPGRLVIGRAAPNSNADIQIDNASNRMSREHLVVEVRKEPRRGFVHYASLCKPVVNTTVIGNTRISYGDTVVLHDGDIIVMPDCSLKFELPDDYETQM